MLRKKRKESREKLEVAIDEVLIEVSQNPHKLSNHRSAKELLDEISSFEDKSYVEGVREGFWAKIADNLKSLGETRRSQIIVFFSLLLHALCVVPLITAKPGSIGNLIGVNSKPVKGKVDELNGILGSLHKGVYSEKIEEELKSDLRVVTSKLERRGATAYLKAKELEQFSAKQKDLLLKDGGINNLAIPYVIFERDRLEDLVEDEIVSHAISNFHKTVKKIKDQVSDVPDQASLSKLVEQSGPLGAYLRTVSTMSESFAPDDENDQKSNCNAKSDRRIAVLVAVYPELADKLYIQDFGDHVRPLVFINDKFYVLDGYFAEELSQNSLTYARNNTIYYYEDELKTVFDIHENTPQFFVQNGQVLNKNESQHSVRLVKELAKRNIDEKELERGFLDPKSVKSAKKKYPRVTDKLRGKTVQDNVVITDPTTGNDINFQLDNIGLVEMAYANSGEKEDRSVALLKVVQEKQYVTEVIILNSCEELRDRVREIGVKVDSENDCFNQVIKSADTSVEVKDRKTKLLDVEAVKAVFASTDDFDTISNRIESYDDVSEEAMALIVEKINMLDLLKFNMIINRLNLTIKKPTVALLESLFKLKARFFVSINGVEDLDVDFLLKMPEIDDQKLIVSLAYKQKRITPVLLRAILSRNVWVTIDEVEEINSTDTDLLEGIFPRIFGFGVNRLKHLDELTAKRFVNSVTDKLVFDHLDPITVATAGQLARLKNIEINAGAFGHNSSITEIMSRHKGLLTIHHAKDLSDEALNGLSGGRDIHLMFGKKVVFNSRSDKTFVDTVKDILFLKKSEGQLMVFVSEILDDYAVLFKGFLASDVGLFLPDKKDEYVLPDGEKVYFFEGNGTIRYALKYSFQLPGNTTEFFDKYMVDLLNFPGEIELRSSKMELTDELKAKLTSAKGRIVFGAFDSKGWKK